jgi:hypothetical protein
MDLEIRAAYIKLNHDNAKMVVRGECPGLEEVDDNYLTFTAEDLESSDLNSVVSQCYDHYDTVSDFLDATGSESDIKEYYEQEFEDEFLGDYSASTVISEWLYCNEKFREFGNELRLSPSMEDELGEMLQAIGIEKIKEIFNIKMVIHHQEQTHEEGQVAQVN